MKVKKSKLFILLGFLVAAFSGTAFAGQFSGIDFPNPPSSASRPNILFVGNSLTFMGGDLTEVLAALCKAENIRGCICEHTVGGCTLARFANPEKEGKNLETVLKLGVWDYVVLQGNSTEAISADPKFSDFRPSVIRLDKEIKRYNPNCKTILFSTVAHVDELEKTAEIYANYKKVGDEIGAVVVPCGMAWMKFGGTNIDLQKIELLFAHKTNPKDLKHPSPYGALLNAYVFYGVLFGRTPEDLHAAIPVGGRKVEPKIADSLKTAAHATLMKYRLLKAAESGLKAEPREPRKADLPMGEMPRRVECFDFDWKFFKGEADNAQQPDFDTSRWQPVDLPHDWSIEGPFDQNAPGKAAFGYFPGGVGLYRKDFEVAAADRGKKYFLQFGGVYENSKVWLNGGLLGQRGYGFIGFEYDLTPYLKFGEKNTVVVRAENLNQPNCRWYSGSGIYRHVWLTVTDPLHVAHWGSYITTPEVGAEKALVRIRTRVENAGEATKNISLETYIFDGRGQLAKVEANESIAAGEVREVAQELVVPNPQLWSPENPKLYTAVCRVVVAGKTVDQISQPFGIRTISFDANRGFILNGKGVKMKGVCLHADGGAVGAAVPVAVWERRLKTLKQIGCNAIRCSHNPPAPEFLDLCDRLGFLVIDEAFDKWQYENARHFAKDWEKDLTAMLERDRNHPSIVLWSVGNENGGVWSDFHFKTYRKLADLVHRFEPTRPVTAALRPFEPPKDDPTQKALIDRLLPMANVLDVACLNYQEHLYEALHAANSNLVIIGSESFQYYRGEGVKYKSTNESNPWFDVARHDYVAGQFLWTGIDYLGESEGWPAIGKANSLIETTGFRKDSSYWRQSVWSDKPMVYIAVFDENAEDYPSKKFWNWPKVRSHWSFAGRENQRLKLATYSNCDAVELFLNGKSLGQKKLADFKNHSAIWEVSYQPGELKAVGIQFGKPVANCVLKTAGPAARINLLPDKIEMKADGQDVVQVEVRIEGAAGILLPDAAMPIHFSVQGRGRLIGLDNGDLRSHESFKGKERTTWRGHCLAIIQSARTSGEIFLSANVPDLPKATLKLEAKK